MPESRKCVVLISGGLDSATVAAHARSEGFEIYALTISYGQRHEVELQAASRVARSVGSVRHVVESIDLRAFGGSALTDSIEVPKSDSVSEMPSGIPATYVPARNTIFLAFALAFAEVIDSSDIFIGVNAVDYSGYPDCRPEFISAFERTATLATKMSVDGRPIRIHAPLIAMSKAEIIRKGASLGIDFAMTHSCYDPSTDGRSCGRCDSCLLRIQGFEQAGMKDPINYAI